MRNIAMIPLILDAVGLPLVSWRMGWMPSIVIQHGQRKQHSTEIIFGGVDDISCPEFINLPKREPPSKYDRRIYNGNGKTVATYNYIYQTLTVWHDGVSSVIILPEHTGIRVINTTC